MKQKNIKAKVKEYFMLNPTIKLRVRQIERELCIPLPSVIRYVKELDQEGILKRTVIANVKLFSADRSSDAYLLEKNLFNLRSIFLSGLVEFLKREYDNPTIILFGSYSKGEDIEESDIDVYIETQNTIKGLEKFEKKLQRKIQLFKYKQISNVRNKDLANNIINGVVLNNFLEVFK